MKLKVQSLGSKREGVVITGDVKRCEPTIFTVEFPGGHVEITRATDGENPDYWVHVSCNHPDSPNAHEDDEKRFGRLVDARVHNYEKSTKECWTGDLAHPATYDVAVRVRPQW